MTTSHRLATTTALVSVFWAAGAAADVAPADVWGDMKQYMLDFGYTVDASESQDGGAIVVSDIRLGMDLPEDAGMMTMGVGEMRFEDNGDGTVGVVLPANMPVTFAVDADGEEFEATLNYDTAGFDMDVSGTPDDMTYTYSADSVTMSLAEIKAEGEVAPPDMVKMVVALNGLSGTSTMKKGNLRTIVQDMTAESLTYDVRVAPPGEGEFTFNGSLNGLASSGTTSVPFGMDMNNMAAALKAGFAVDADLTHQGGSMNFMANEDGEVTQGSSASTGGTLGVAMSDERLGYTVGGDGMEINLQGGEIPFPVSLKMAKMLLDFTVPVSKGEAPQDVAIKLTMADFQMSDMIWSIVDGQQILPRDPATVMVDLTGKVMMLVDLLDPEQMEAVENGEMIPAMPDSVTLNQLVVSAAGARVEGDGALTFDPSDMQTIPGMPRPEGAVNLTVNGANGLIDKLIQMGLVQEEDAMGARMMMSMFTVPGEGEDSLKSTIEINEQGHILANGQRIR